MRIKTREDMESLTITIARLVQLTAEGLAVSQYNANIGMRILATGLPLLSPYSKELSTTAIVGILIRERFNDGNT